MSDIINLTLEDCEKIAKIVLKSDKVKIVDISVVHIENETYSLKIKVTHENQEKNLRFLAESSSSVSAEILQELDNLCSNTTPKLYQLKGDLQIFEDLYWKGFQRYNLEKLDPNHIKIVLKTLAKLHSSSLAYEEFKSQNYRLDQEYNLKSFILDLSKPEISNLIKSLVDDTSEDKLAEVITHLQHYQSWDKYRKVLSHSNLILDNLLFKYEDNTPHECRLINFKSKLYAPPAYDVLQVIFNNTDEDLRQHHFHDFLDFYYKNLEQELKVYSLKIDNLVSVDDWQLQIHDLLCLVKLEKCLKVKQFAKELKEDLNCLILSKEDCYQIVRNKLKTTFYKFISYKVSSVTSVSGFLGDYYRLKIKILYQNEEMIIYGFIKCKPKAKAPKLVVDDGNSFAKEAFIYQTMIPKFQEFKIKEINECLPEFYFKRVQEMIIIEDLNEQNYKTISSREPYDFPTLVLILKKVAKFHACAFIYEEKKSKQLGRKYRMNEDFNNFFQESLIVNNGDHAGGKLIAVAVKTIYQAINLFPELQTEENLKNFDKNFEKIKNLFYSTLTASDEFRNVLSHGDLWSSNILLEFKNDEATDCRFVDYQLLRYCPPGHDFLSIMHLTTIRETRLKHEDKLKIIYHQEMKRILEKYELDIEEILPFDDLSKGLDLMKPEMLIQAAIYSMSSMCTAEEINSWLHDEEASNKIFFEDRREFITKMCETSVIYKSRLRDRLLDIFEYCNSME